MPTDTSTELNLAKVGAKKLTPEEQRRRFIEAARELGCDESSNAFEAAVKKVARHVASITNKGKPERSK